MKKRIKKYGILLSVLFLVCMLQVHADSGWDGSYGGGSSSSWGGSSSSSSWGGSSWSSSGSSHYYSSGSSSLSDGEILLIFVIIINFVIFYMIAKSVDKENKAKAKPSLSLFPYDIDKIKKVLPDFDKEKFKYLTYEIYKKIQIAWMEFDYETLRRYTTDELYNLYHSQLMALHMKKQKNIMSDFELNDFEITSMEQGKDSLALTVRMIVECRDYVVNKDEKIVRGSDNYKLIYDYEMTFIMGLGQKDNKCPNCNAPLENQHSTVCPYCDSTIINTHHNWVLSKKRMVNQKRKL